MNGHALAMGFGLEDELEMGFVAKYTDLEIDRDGEEGDVGAFGPNIRIRTSKDDPYGWMPQTAIGAYTLWATTR